MKTKKLNFSSEGAFIALIDAYIKIVAQNGVEVVTLSTLSKKVGLSTATVKYHLDNSKIKLESAARDRVRDDINLYIDESIAKDRTQIEFCPLRSYAFHMLNWAVIRPHMSSFLLFIYYKTSLKNADLNSPYAPILSRALSRIEALLNEGIGRGIYELEADRKKQFIAYFHSIVLGNLIILINMKDQDFLQERFQLIDSQLKTITYFKDKYRL